MNKIDKSRKGVVFGMMTPKERKCLKKAENVIDYFNGEWNKVLKEELKFNEDIAYWCPDWDNPTGEELIGKLCRVWDEDEDKYDFFIVTTYSIKFDGVVYYSAGNDYWKHARLATEAEALKLIGV